MRLLFGARLVAWLLIASSPLAFAQPTEEAIHLHFSTASQLVTQYMSYQRLASGVGNSTQEDLAEAIKLTAYITGVHDSLSGIAVCAPMNVDRRQLVEIAMRHIQQSPERWHFAASDFVADALANGFSLQR